MDEVIAVIPARGGSKGVPRKNVRRVGGVPLVARAISAARAAHRVDRVVVSTDDAEIAAVAEEWGAQVIARPASLAGDEASSESALLHALEEIERTGDIPRVLVFLQATSPFIAAESIDEAVEDVVSGRADSVFSAVETYGFLWERDGDGQARAVNHRAAHRPRRQDRAPHYLETGAFYVMDIDGFRTAGHRFFGRIGIVEVPAGTAVEIDTEEELSLARAIAPLVDVPSHIAVDAVVTDFDGVHTDDTLQLDATGREFVRVSRSDGMGVALLRRAGIPILVLSSETDGVVGARAGKLGADVVQGCDDKVAALRGWADERGIPLARIAYLGNDVNDLACLELVGWPVAVADAHPLVIAAARVVLDRAGGDGAVRELIDRVLRARTGARPDSSLLPSSMERTAP